MKEVFRERSGSEQLPFVESLSANRRALRWASRTYFTILSFLSFPGPSVIESIRSPTKFLNNSIILDYRSDIVRSRLPGK